MREIRASDLQDQIVTRLLREVGGTRRRWRIVVGAVTVDDPRTHPHCNWSVSPSGSSREVGEVERLLDGLRLEQPYALAG